jgi:hypothetical protein
MVIVGSSVDRIRVNTTDPTKSAGQHQMARSLLTPANNESTLFPFRCPGLKHEESVETMDLESARWPCTRKLFWLEFSASVLKFGDAPVQCLF